MKSVSSERRDREVERLIEDFLAKLSKRLPKHEKSDYSVKELERRTRSLASVLSTLSQRWSLLIVFVLYMRSLKFNELRELLPGISSRTLTDKLRMLESDGILTRTVVSSGPLRVNYALTKRGREIALSCLPLMYELSKHD